MKYLLFVIILLIVGAISCETYHGETEEALMRDITTPQTADDDYQKKESEIVQPFIYLKNRTPTEKYMDLQTDTTEEIIDYAKLEEYEKVIIPGILRKESEENTEEHKDKNEDVTTRATSSTRRPFKNMGKKSVFDICHDIEDLKWYQLDNMLLWWFFKCDKALDFEKFLLNEAYKHPPRIVNSMVGDSMITTIEISPEELELNRIICRFYRDLLPLKAWLSIVVRPVAVLMVKKKTYWELPRPQEG
ncbi:unnamed protein product [Orchesella dallaii]|uniref:Uncharacterized protein n=1 Tax=Orchesella dallaii TaxID=48710 RepID=A0ABP1Q088_9HEXA